MDSIKNVGTGVNTHQHLASRRAKGDEGATINTKDGFGGSIEQKPDEIQNQGKLRSFAKKVAGPVLKGGLIVGGIALLGSNPAFYPTLAVAGIAGLGVLTLRWITM